MCSNVLSNVVSRYAALACVGLVTAMVCAQNSVLAAASESAVGSVYVQRAQSLRVHRLPLADAPFIFYELRNGGIVGLRPRLHRAVLQTVDGLDADEIARATSGVPRFPPTVKDGRTVQVVHEEMQAYPLATVSMSYGDNMPADVFSVDISAPPGPRAVLGSIAWGECCPGLRRVARLATSSELVTCHHVLGRHAQAAAGRLTAAILAKPTSATGFCVRGRHRSLTALRERRRAAIHGGAPPC